MDDVMLTLNRFLYTDNSVTGMLYYNGEFQCYTLEDKVRPDGVKVFGETAIPAGTYGVIYDYSPKFSRQMPLLVGVPNFEGVRIHIGNSPKDTEGCVLVGSSYSKDTPDWISSSGPAFATLDQKMQDAISGNGKITISIVDAAAPTQ